MVLDMPTADADDDMDDFCDCMTAGRCPKAKENCSVGTTDSLQHGKQSEWETMKWAGHRLRPSGATCINLPLARSPEINGFRVDTSGPYSRTYTRGNLKWSKSVQHPQCNNETGKCQVKRRIFRDNRYTMFVFYFIHFTGNLDETSDHQNQQEKAGLLMLPDPAVHHTSVGIWIASSPQQRAVLNDPVSTGFNASQQLPHHWFRILSTFGQ